MLSIISKDNPDNVTPLMLDDEDWYVVHAYNGADTLQFTVASQSAYRWLFEEETKVLATGLRGGDNRFVVKNIDSHSGSVVVDCSIDLYDWQRTIYDTYRHLNYTLEDVLRDITPSGWTYSGQQQFGQSVTVEDARNEPFKAATPLDILNGCQELFGCVFNFDVINRKLTVIDPESYAPSGDFLSDEVNLKSVGFVGNTDSYATRLYAYGKRDDNGENPVTFESINNGKPYIDNNKFSDDVICVGWSDERYTIPENLLAAAKVKLASMATPIRSYECEVSQLNRKIWLYMVLTLITTDDGTRVDHQIVEWKEYARPDLDVVTLSATQPSIEDIINDNFGNNDGVTDDELWGAINGAVDGIHNAYQEAIDKATDMIVGNNGGYFKQIFDADGNWIELLNLGDSMDVNQARQVWRWNASGLGHSNNGINGSFDLALLADGSINATMMTTGILQGGQSYWNLNTGDLSIVGRFRTHSDVSEAGVDINPNFSTYYPSEGGTNDAAAVEFMGPYASRPGVRANSGTSSRARAAIEMFSGKWNDANRCSYVLASSSPNYSGATVFDTRITSSASAGLLVYQSYPNGGTPSLERAFVEAACVSGTDTSGSGGAVIDNYFQALARNVAGGFVVGIGASARLGRVYIGGALDVYSGSGTFVCGRYTISSAENNVYYEYDLAVATPAAVGGYLGFTSVRHSQYDTHSAISGTTSASVDTASGVTAFVKTFPTTLYAAGPGGNDPVWLKTWDGYIPLVLNILCVLVSFR